MDAPACQGCRERDARIAVLEKEIRSLRAELFELKARLGLNSTNSSIPPSANPPGAPKPAPKKRSRRRRGGQPGHPGSSRERLPPERVDQVVPHYPERCERCQAPLPKKAGPEDPPPTWHQIIELPPVTASVVEHQGHARTCPQCGHLTKRSIPQEILAHGYGERLCSLVALLSGRFHLSKRGVAEFTTTVLGAPMSVGTVSRLEREMSGALAGPRQQAVQAIRQADIKNVDETGWKEKARGRWLWAGISRKVAAFLIHRRRGVKGLQGLLGKQRRGWLGSDRWSAYQAWPVEWRQLCWAHLRRDFQRLVDRGGCAKALGEEALEIADFVFTAWHLFREGIHNRRWLRREIAWQRDWLHELLERGRRGRDKKARRFCANLLQLEPALWAFARIEGLEPTNNASERILRQGVLWRKCAFGCASAAGCRFVERILTVVETLRLQGRRVLDYLHRALVAHRARQMAPSLLCGP